ncbi:hypothetical protein N7468_009374 [Penicillium chermesinum]|uniref:Mis12-Mtw1 family protein n=1 Tax=Penicillium chermesinum TaxID=63820 RepID=A0A9W9NHQ8_9EURO|nr:uncharacterized protein N7468_009374 [Penicillium chermesinum]KAJ5220170.1 hypothetical protein N7468_009374 [Penicillium chermesinum]
MTTTVIAATTTKVKRREPLGTIGMAASQAQSRSAGASGRTAGKRSARLGAAQDGLGEMTNKGGKRPAVYEEDEDGFQFSRKPSKKPRPSVEPASGNPQSDLENAPPKSTPKRGRPPKKQKDSASAAAVSVKGPTTELPTRRPTRGNGNKADVQPASESQPTQMTRSPRNHEPPSPELPPAKERKRGRPARPKNPEPNGFKSPEPPSVAMPHPKVGTEEFFKHIADSGLPEPRRMRQLLVWCATRAMGAEKSSSRSEDPSARLAARVIQEEILKDLSTNDLLSNWFSREDVNPPTIVVKKPNPRNVQNMDKIKELEEHIQKLQKERHALNALHKQPTIPPVTSDPEMQPKRKAQTSPYDHIDTSLLDPSQQALLASLHPPAQTSSEDKSSSSRSLPPVSPSTVSTRLSKITTGLAPTLDAFAAGIHDIELYRSSADAVSSRILRICSQRLEERDALNTQQWLAIEGNDNESHTPGEGRARRREDLGMVLGALSRIERR